MKKNPHLHTLMLLFISLALLVSNCKKDDNEPETVTDIDGNVYHRLTIGTQVWLKENLKVTKLNDGTAISLVTGTEDWSTLAGTAYCWYDNNPANKNLYGALYNGYAVSTGKLCPAGWHVPSESELTILVNFLGGESVAGGQLKTTGTIEGGDGLWYQPNVAATNETEFSALPGGMRGSGGNFSDFGYGGVWWTSTIYPNNALYYFFINNFDSTVGDSYDGANQRFGFSVRCIRD